MSKSEIIKRFAEENGIPVVEIKMADKDESTELMNKMADTNIPFVGMGVTYGYDSDRYPGTIVWVSPSKRRIRYQADNWRRTDHNGFSESQEYEITPNPDGPIYEASLRKDGTWRDKGTKYGSVGLGFKRAYQDPCF